MKSRHPTTPARAAIGRPKDLLKHDDIVKAASLLFLKEGYTLTSVEAVARKAGVSKITIYSHFANKDELFKAVIQRRCDKLAFAQRFSAHSGKPVREALLALAENIVTIIFSSESVRLNRIIQGEATRHPQVVKIWYDAGPRPLKKQFNELLASWVNEGQLAIDDIEKATEQFFSLLKGEYHSRTMLLLLPGPNKREIKFHVKATVDFFLAATRPAHSRI